MQKEKVKKFLIWKVLSWRKKIMLGKFFECEADKTDKYYRVIQTLKEYPDGRRFPIG